MHIIALTMLTMMYIGWTYIGKLITGEYAYYFLDYEVVGWERVAISVMGMIGLVMTCKLTLLSQGIC